MRPADLPQPVRKRDHTNRESNTDRWRSGASPGPARYSGAGVTEFERDTRGGTFGKDSRFKKGQLVPGDSFSTAERSSFLEGAGPKYTPKFMDTRLSTGFSRTSHLTHSKENGSPGPGAYAPSMSWDRGVTIPNSHRTSRSANNTPGPGAYNPTKLPIRTRSAFVGSTSDLDTANAISRKLDRPPLAGLDAIDRSMLTTRAQSPSVSFTKAERRLVLTIAEANPVGAGAYNVESSDSATQRAVKGGKFSTSRRMPNAKPDTDGRLVSLPSAELLSNHSASPSISFTKAAPKRGIPDDVRELGNVPTAKYSPKYTAVDRAVKGVVGWGKPRPGKDRSTLQPSITSNADFMSNHSTFGEGPSISFPESRRPINKFGNTPGPGAYTPTLKGPKKEPRASGFTKAKRELASGIVGENTPGPIYHPDYTVLRPPVAPEITMTKSPRRTKMHVPTDAPDASYDPKYSQVDKGGRSAIIYLTE